VEVATRGFEPWLLFIIRLRAEEGEMTTWSRASINCFKESSKARIKNDVTRKNKVGFPTKTRRGTCYWDRDKGITSFNVDTAGSQVLTYPASVRNWKLLKVGEGKVKAPERWDQSKTNAELAPGEEKMRVENDQEKTKGEKQTKAAPSRIVSGK